MPSQKVFSLASILKGSSYLLGDHGGERLRLVDFIHILVNKTQSLTTMATLYSLPSNKERFVVLLTDALFPAFINDYVKRFVIS